MFDGEKSKAVCRVRRRRARGLQAVEARWRARGRGGGAAGPVVDCAQLWLFGALGRCFPKTVLRLAGERDQLNVAATWCPTFTGRLAQALVALTMGGRAARGVLHVAGASCSWFKFASKIVAAAGSNCEVHPIGTDQYPLPGAASRPQRAPSRSAGAPALPVLARGPGGISSPNCRRWRREAPGVRCGRVHRLDFVRAAGACDGDEGDGARRAKLRRTRENLRKVESESVRARGRSRTPRRLPARCVTPRRS